MTANPPTHLARVVFTNGDGDVQYRAILGLFARSTLAPVQLLQFASVGGQPRRAPRPNGNWRGCVGLPVRPAVAVATATPSAPGPPWADGSGLVPGGRGPYICAKTNWYRFFSALETRRLHATASYLPAIGPDLISSADLPGIAFRTWFYAGAEITGRTR